MRLHGVSEDLLEEFRREKRRKIQRRMRRKYAKLGRCHCSRPRVPGKKKCVTCAAKRRPGNVQSTAELRNLYRSHNLCPHDGRPVVPGRKGCARCLKQARARRKLQVQIRLEEGRCVNCGAGPCTPYRRCAQCRKVQAERQLARTMAKRARAASAGNT